MAAGLRPCALDLAHRLRKVQPVPRRSRPGCSAWRLLSRPSSPAGRPGVRPRSGATRCSGGCAACAGRGRRRWAAIRCGRRGNRGGASWSSS